MSTCGIETRTGYAFGNPDTTSNYHAPVWGLLVTADELRYDELFGNDLVSSGNNQFITDDQLLDYVRLAIRYFEVELNIDILPRRIRYSSGFNEDGSVNERTDFDDTIYLSRMTRKQKKALYLEETGYKFDVIKARQELRIKLYRRPVREILTANFVDPYYDTTIINLLPYRIVKKGFSGVVYFRPLRGTSRLNSVQYNYIFNNYLYPTYTKNLQRIFCIDYETGYENCEDVPDEFRNIIKKTAACTLMNIYGDGKTSAIASRSVNLNSVSESISTTLSATSAAFGARIIQYQKELKEWYKQNRSKYSRTTIGVL